MNEKWSYATVLDPIYMLVTYEKPNRIAGTCKDNHHYCYQFSGFSPYFSGLLDVEKKKGGECPLDRDSGEKKWEWRITIFIK